jgi:hypothetical protein
MHSFNLLPFVTTILGVSGLFISHSDDEESGTISNCGFSDFVLE